MAGKFDKERAKLPHRGADSRSELLNELHLEEQAIDDTDKALRNEKNMEKLFHKLERFTVDGPSERSEKALLALAASYALPSAANAERTPQTMATRQCSMRSMPRAGNARLQLLQRVIAQTGTMHWLFWICSAIAIGAATALQAYVQERYADGPNVLLIALLIVPVASVAYSLRSLRTPMGELEATFPVTPAQLMAARIGIILGYHIGLGLMVYSVAAAAGYGSGAGNAIVQLITTLLLPLFLSTFAAWASMLCFGTWPGTVVVLALGAIQLVAGDKLGVFQLFSEYGSPGWLPSKLIGIGLMLALAVAIRLLASRKRLIWQWE